MTPRDDLDRRLATWLEDVASAPVPRGRFERVVEATRAARPRARAMARVGSDWIGDRSRAIELDGLRWGVMSMALLTLLLALAVVGVALVGGRLARPETQTWRLGSLVYGAQGTIYLAGADGSSPVAIASGTDPTWSPDGQRLMYWQGDVVHVARADGRALASFPGWVSSWSPDSSRIATWAGPGVEIHEALDGNLLVSLAQAATLLRPGDPGPPAWLPDGRAIMVDYRYWVLPIDGSAVYRLGGGDGLGELGRFVSFSPTGQHLVGLSSGRLVVADADGSHRRLVAEELASNPIWSPTGTRIAYVRTVAVGSQATRDELRVIDLVSDTDRVIAALPDASLLLRISLVEWSPGSDRIMLRQEQEGVKPSTSLISVDVATGAWDLLVDGIENGAWQWIAE